MNEKIVPDTTQLLVKRTNCKHFLFLSQLPIYTGGLLKNLKIIKFIVLHLSIKKFKGLLSSYHPTEIVELFY